MLQERHQRLSADGALSNAVSIRRSSSFMSVSGYYSSPMRSCGSTTSSPDALPQRADRILSCVCARLTTRWTSSAHGGCVYSVLTVYTSGEPRLRPPSSIPPWVSFKYTPPESLLQTSSCHGKAATRRDLHWWLRRVPHAAGAFLLMLSAFALLLLASPAVPLTRARRHARLVATRVDAVSVRGGMRRQTTRSESGLPGTCQQPRLPWGEKTLPIGCERKPQLGSCKR